MRRRDDRFLSSPQAEALTKSGESTPERVRHALAFLAPS
jgi:hypothetical protein